MIKLYTVKTSNELWYSHCSNLYHSKINNYLEFKMIELKSPQFSRHDKTIKKVKESEKILASLSDKDFVILCDENGQSMDSEKFSKFLFTKIETLGNNNIVFVIGGAFGVDQSVKKRANTILYLSPFILNHYVASVVLLEQIYRGICIQRNLPYHNK